MQSFQTEFLTKIKETITASVSKRLQAVVGALAKIDKFNSSIALDEKLLKIESGEVKVRFCILV